MEEISTVHLERQPHQCPACPVEVRDLYAVAHNLLNELEQEGVKLTCRGWRKAEDLRQSVKRMGFIVEEHFKDIERR